MNIFSYIEKTAATLHEQLGKPEPDSYFFDPVMNAKDSYTTMPFTFPNLKAITGGAAGAATGAALPFAVDQAVKMWKSPELIGRRATNVAGALPSPGMLGTFASRHPTAVSRMKMMLPVLGALGGAYMGGASRRGQEVDRDALTDALVKQDVLRQPQEVGNSGFGIPGALAMTLLPMFAGGALGMSVGRRLGYTEPMEQVIQGARQGVRELGGDMSPENMMSLQTAMSQLLGLSGATAGVVGGNILSDMMLQPDVQMEENRLRGLLESKNELL